MTTPPNFLKSPFKGLLHAIVISLIHLSIAACQPDGDIEIPTASVPLANAEQNNQVQPESSVGLGEETTASEPSIPIVEDEPAPPPPVGVVASGVTPSPAAAPVSTPPIIDGTYEIKSASNAMCLDIPNSDRNAGTNVLLYDCNRTTAQSFEFKIVEASGIYKLTNTNSGLALGVRGEPMAAGSRIEQNVETGEFNQLFLIVPVPNSQFFMLKPKGEDLAIDIIASTSGNWDPIALDRAEEGKINQHFILTRLP